MNLYRKNVFVLVSGLLLTALLAAALGCRKPQTPAPGKSNLHVVVLAPLTGPGASLGEYLRNGVDLAQQEVASRYPGKIELTVEVLDSKNQPTEGVNALQSALVRKRPDAVISAMSSVSKAVVPLVEREGILTIATTTALTDLPKGTKTVVRVYPTSDDFVRPIATAMSQRFERVGVLYVHDDFGDSNQRLFTTIVQAAGKKVTGAEPFELAQADSRTTIARLLATSPQAVFVTGYGPAFVAVFKQLKEANRDLPIYTEIGFANPAILGALGHDADGIIFDATAMELSAPQDSRISSFQSQYRTRFKTEPYQVAGFAHDSILLLVEAVMKSPSLAKPDKLALIAVSPLQGVMGPIYFDGDGECRVPLKLMQRVSGQTVLLNQ